MGIALVGAVRNGTVVEQRRKHVPHRRNDVVEAADVEISLLLACERGVGQVLGGRRRAHGDRDVVAAGQALPGFPDLPFQFCGQWCLADPAPDIAASGRQRGNIVHVEAIEALRDAISQAVLCEKLPVRIRRGCEPVRDTDAQSVEIADHLAERGILAPDKLDVAHAELGKGKD